MTSEALCPGCGDIVAGSTYHPECCPHDHVDSQDYGAGDGWEAPVHDWEHRCLDCGTELIPDGQGGWDRP